MTCPAGMIDLDQNQFIIRNHIFDIAKKCFETRGSVQIDTPVIEMMSTVENLYGGDFNKQVFTLDDNTPNENAHTKMLLRYDLTVPLCRYVSSRNLKQFRRHQIGKVYRKDNPQIAKGRFREFYQMDFDIIGNSEENIYDFEMIDTLCDVMDKLVNLENVIIKINHKSIILSLLQYANIDNLYSKEVLSILDRLDKCNFDDIQNELTEYIGEQNVLLLKNIYNNKSFEIVSELLHLDDSIINYINQLFEFKPCLKFDPFLIRGMDYYTGLLFEVSYIDLSLMPFTISAGGRYDNMIGSFGGENIPAIGMSLGIERIAKILEKTTMSKINKNMYDLYVATICKSENKNIILEQLKICSELRSAGYKVLTSHIKEQKFKRHFDNVFENNIQYMIILGDSELKNNTISIKNIFNKEQVTIDRYKLINYLDSLFNSNIQISDNN